MNIVILAAGMGKRMRSRLPKVLQPIAGRPMLDHVLDATAPFAAGSPRIIVVGHGAEAVEARYADRTDVRFALQSPQLGTGHALMQAVPSLDKNDPATLVCLGDVPLLSSETIRRMTEAAETNEMVLLTVELENPTGYGRIKRAEGRPYAIVEEKDATDDERRIREVNTGIMLLPTARLEGWLSSLTNTNAQGEYYLTDVLALAAHEGVSIAAVQPDHVWEVEGVNSKPQLARLERVWQRVQADRLMDAGVTLLDPDRIDIRGTLTCGRDVEIDVGCVFEGNVVLADGVKVGANCVLKNVEVGEDTVILPFCHLEGARVGAAGRIGPYSRLRPGAELAGGNHIGNFVEVKKSVVGEGTKINHLAYVGDADVGARVNIGAGCITCNYDGVNKFRTVIGDDAFIGSDTQLIAPVKVGAGATIGAGTTLTREAPEGKLTLSRARQVTIEGWKRPVKKA
ncbi:MAG: bifunctional UDP-N-acetylglucosamine diphosphorylase/glucosamine-1-phosphate N-acetyltransferase GlmU [Sutterella sp.]|nr:bifunctional UDP-N-acetylglucosamine diphosphorylase/glucosamine-1-phosphate N-acetyltransferase GlmU [Sutterella sp.]